MGRSTRLVILGDSVAAGYGLRGRADRAFPRFVERRLARADRHVGTTVSALDGIDTGYALRRFERMVASHEPDIVVTLLGLNDAAPPGDRTPNSPATFERNLALLVERVQSLDASPVLVAPNPRFRHHNGRVMDCRAMHPYVAAVARVADRCRVPWVDLHARFERARDLSRWLPDGIHPCAAGHRVIGHAIVERLLPLVEQRTCGESVAAHRAVPHAQAWAD